MVSEGDESFPGFWEYRRRIDEQVAQSMGAVSAGRVQSAVEVRAAVERELEQRGVRGLPPERVDVIVHVILAGSRRFGRLRLIPMAIRGAFAPLHAFYQILTDGESQPRWLRPPHGDWGLGPAIDHPLPVRISSDATVLCDRIAEEAFKEDDGRRFFSAWLSHVVTGDAQGRVVVHAGRQVLGDLSPGDAAEIADDVRAMQKIGIHLYAWATMKVTETSNGDNDYIVTVRANHIDKRNIA